MANDNESLKPGGRNLLLLCMVGIVMALVSTSISLIIYRSTGDIYLDRSRPKMKCMIRLTTARKASRVTAKLTKTYSMATRKTLMRFTKGSKPPKMLSRTKLFRPKCWV